MDSLHVMVLLITIFTGITALRSLAGWLPR